MKYLKKEISQDVKGRRIISSKMFFNLEWPNINILRRWTNTISDKLREVDEILKERG